MQVNVTLIIQAANFVCAYLVLNHFFLKPAVHALESDEQATKDLFSSIMSRRAVIDEIERHQQEQWQLCKKQIAQTIPQVVIYEEVMEKSKKVDRLPVQISPTHEYTLVQQVSQYFVKKIQDKYD